MRVAVIGAGGFIGKNLVNSLIKRENVDLKLFGSKIISPFSDNYDYSSIDLLNENEISEKLKDIDFVFYLASKSIPFSSWENPMYEINENLTPFMNLLKVSDTSKIKKICFISSGGTIYGESDEVFYENSSKSPYTPYGIIKLTMENFLEYYKKKHNLNYTVLRVSNVYGPGQNTIKGLGLINIFLENIIKGQTVRVYGDGNNIRNYIL